MPYGNDNDPYENNDWPKDAVSLSPADWNPVSTKLKTSFSAYALRDNVNLSDSDYYSLALPCDTYVSLTVASNDADEAIDLKIFTYDYELEDSSKAKTSENVYHSGFNHSHDHSISYSAKNDKAHYAHCFCKASKLEGHCITGTSTKCIMCGASASMGFLGKVDVNDDLGIKFIGNGSFIYDGITWLSPLDYRNYLSGGTL